MRFFIVNAFHRDDKGDAALVHVLIDQLLSIDPHAHIALSSMEDPDIYPTFYKAENVGSFELYSSSHKHSFPAHLFVKAYLFCSLFIIGKTRGKFSWLLPSETKKIYEECKSADLVVSVGGGYFLTNRGLGSRMHLLFTLQTLILLKQLGRKVVTAPVSVGPFEYAIEAKYTAWVLRKLDLVLLREAISEKYFIDKRGNLFPNVGRAPDSAFAFSPSGSFDIRKLIGAKTGDLVLALSVRHWMTKEKQAIYQKAHADLIDHISEKYPNIKPVFIPQCIFPHVDDDDRKVAESILKLSKSKNAFVIKDDLDYQKVKLAYQKTDFVVGTRFHSMVFGLSYNVPGVAIEYEHKTRGIMRELGLEEWVISIDSIDTEQLINLFDEMIYKKNPYKTLLLKEMPTYIDSTNKVTEAFSEILKK